MASAKLIPLKDAPWSFASPRLRTAWQRAQDAPSSSKAGEPDTASSAILRKRISEDPAEAVKIVADSVGNILEGLRSRSAPELAMRELLLQNLRDGKLEAWGVETAPDRKRDLELLPPYFFMDAKIGWSKNSVTNLGATYGAVQVRRGPSMTAQATPKKASNISNDVSSSIASTPAGRTYAETNPASADFRSHALEHPADHEIEGTKRQRPGPPSGADLVVAAYEDLRAKGELKDEATIADIARKIARTLKSNTKAFPNGRGLSYPSIARHLRPHLTGLSKFSS